MCGACSVAAGSVGLDCSAAEQSSRPCLVVRTKCGVLVWASVLGWWAGGRRAVVFHGSGILGQSALFSIIATILKFALLFTVIS